MTDTNRNPDCQMHEALVSYLYNEAGTDERRAVETHLRECAACKQELESFERVRGMLQHWQLDDMPIVRVAVAADRKRGALALFKELFSVTPLWAKALGAVALGMLLLAVIGTEVKVGREGFQLRADILRRGGASQAAPARDDYVTASNLEQVRADLKSLVGQLIADSERQQREDLKARLVSLQTEIQEMHSAELQKIASRVQEHQSKIKTLERDIDRREGLDLTDILFGELPAKPAAGSGTD